MEELFSGIKEALEHSFGSLVYKKLTARLLRPSAGQEMTSVEVIPPEIFLG